MPVIQVALDVPPDIALGLATGELIRMGGVVRRADGKQLAKLLDDASLSKEPQKVAKALASKASDVPTPVWWLVGIAATAGAVGVGYWARRRHLGKAPAPDTELQTALAAYLDAAREKRLDTDKIERLIASIDALPDPTAGVANQALDAADSDELLTAVADFTRRLAETNGVDMTNALDTVPSDVPTLPRLRRYLEIQREVFTNAA